MQKKLAIFTNGSVKQGMGHIYRSLHLAQELKKKFEITFFTTSHKKATNIITSQNFTVVKSQHILEKLIAVNPDIVIIDNLQVEENFAREIKKQTKSKLVIFGNTSSANKYAELVINGMVDSDGESVERRGKRNQTEYLSGGRYVGFKKNIYHLYNRYTYKKEISNILLCFGGSDPLNLSTKVTKKILENNTTYKITIVVGPLFSFKKELKHIARNCPRVTFLENIFNLERQMLMHDFAITSPGSTMFEAIMLGVPTLAFYQSVYQKKVFSKIPNIFSFSRNFDLEKNILSIYKNYKTYKNKWSRYQIGEGKKQIIYSIKNL